MISYQNLGADQPFQQFNNPFTKFPVRSFGRREPIQVLPTTGTVRTFNPYPVTGQNDLQAQLIEARNLASKYYSNWQACLKSRTPAYNPITFNTLPVSPMGPPLMTF